jgi:Transcriptional regulator PadR-like family
MPAFWKKLWGARRATRELDLIVLQTLDTLGSLHGYGIADGLERFSLGGFHGDAAALYPALARLERRQLVTATWSISADVNRRARFIRSPVLAAGISRPSERRGTASPLPTRSCANTTSKAMSSRSHGRSSSACFRTRMKRSPVSTTREHADRRSMSAATCTTSSGFLIRKF